MCYDLAHQGMPRAITPTLPDSDREIAATYGDAMSIETSAFHTARCGSALHLLLALSMGIFFAVPVTQAELIDTVVATVDTEVILYSEVAESAAPLLDPMQLSAMSETQRRQQIAEAQRMVLEQAIDQKILYREALLAGLPERMTQLDEMVEEQVDAIRDQYQSTEEFMAMVQAAGETLSDFRARLRKKILAISMANAKLIQFEKEVVIDETELAAYYEKNKDQFSNRAQAKVRRIYIDAGDDDAGRARARARLDALRQELSLGADFAALAKAHSDGPEAEVGGLLGWISHNPDDPTLDPAVDAAVFALAAGEVSDVVETQYGFLLLKVEETRAAGTGNLDTVRTAIEPQLRRELAQDRYEKWVSELRKRSRVAVYSF
jgi:parvulin-like peptidyl-prolyl isomerase